MSIEINVINFWDGKMIHACREEAISASLVLEVVEAGSASVAGLTPSIWRPARDHREKNTVFSPLIFAEKGWESMLSDFIYITGQPWIGPSRSYFCMRAEGKELQNLVWKMLCQCCLFELLQVTVVSSWWVACGELLSGCTFFFFLQWSFQFPPQTILPLHLLLYHGQWGLFPSDFSH